MASIENQKKETPKSVIRHPIVWGFSVFILAVIIVSFAVGPVLTRMVSTQGDLVFGRWDGKEIEYLPGNYLDNQKNSIANSIGNADDQNLISQQYQVWRGAFERTVVHTAMVQEATKSGLLVTDVALNKALLNYSGFLDNAGQFSEDRYNTYANRDLDRINNLVQESIIQQRFSTDLTYPIGTGPAVSSAEVDFITSMGSRERQFKYVTLTYNDFPESSVATYGQNNSKLFRSIELGRITVNKESDAQDIHSQLEADPDSFGQLALDRSSDIYSAQEGNMGQMMFSDLQPQLEDEADLETVFGLAEGEVSPVLTSGDSYIIYKAESSVTQPDFTDDDTLQAVREYMERLERGIIEDYLTTRAEQFTVAAVTDGFDSAAVSFDLTPKTTSYVPLNYGNVSFNHSQFGQIPLFMPLAGDSVLNQASTRDDFLQQLFTLDVEEISTPLIASGNVGVFQVTDEREADEDQLNAVESFYNYAVQQWTQERVAQVILQSDKLDDFFLDTFRDTFINNQQ